MEKCRRYVVTKPSEDGTFEVGDHIWMNEDDSVSCREAGGWVDADDVGEALRGVEMEDDNNFADTRRKALQDELAKLDAQQGYTKEIVG